MSVRCPKCRYEITVLSNDRCSECGTVLDVVERARSTHTVDLVFIICIGVLGVGTCILNALSLVSHLKRSAQMQNLTNASIGNIGYSYWYDRISIFDTSVLTMLSLGMFGNLYLLIGTVRPTAQTDSGVRAKRRVCIVTATVVVAMCMLASRRIAFLY